MHLQGPSADCFLQIRTWTCSRLVVPLLVPLQVCAADHYFCAVQPSRVMISRLPPWNPPTPWIPVHGHPWCHHRRRHPVSKMTGSATPGPTHWADRETFGKIFCGVYKIDRLFVVTSVGIGLQSLAVVPRRWRVVVECPFFVVGTILA